MLWILVTVTRIKTTSTSFRFGFDNNVPKFQFTVMWIELLCATSRPHLSNALKNCTHCGNCHSLLRIPLENCTNFLKLYVARGSVVIWLLKQDFPVCSFPTIGPRNGEDSSEVLSRRSFKPHPRHLWKACNTSKTETINTLKNYSYCFTL